jgi:hypothetical protein
LSRRSDDWSASSRAIKKPRRRRACPGGATTGQLARAAPTNVGNTGRQHNSTTNLYEWDWKTTGLKAGSYEIEVTLTDGTVHEEKITLKA